MRSRLVRLLVISALLLVGTAPPLQADYWKGEVYYYSSGSYTTVIGYFVRYCDNSTSNRSSRLRARWSRSRTAPSP